MRFYLVLGATAALLLASEAFAQCRGGGGGGGGGATASGGTQVAAFSGNVGTFSSPQMLTGPGSDFYDSMLRQQAQQAYARQQYQIAAAKAAKEQARRDKIKASIIAQRERELIKRGKTIPSPGMSLASNGK